jgi:hypothetical protein
MEELIKNSSEDSMYWINRFFYGSDDYSTEGSANPNRDYFTFNGYGNVISFDYIYNSYTDEFNHIDIDDLIDYIIENQNSFYNDDIQEVLDEIEEAGELDETEEETEQPSAELLKLASKYEKPETESETTKAIETVNA